jgi:SHS family lactate transporter-like MFS transporter
VASGILQGGYPCGYFLAIVTYYFVFPIWGWRVLFLVGILPALLLVFIRLRVKESPVFEARREALQKSGKKETGISAVGLFKPGMLGNTAHACLLMVAAQTSSFCMTLLWPTYLIRELHLTIGQRTQFVMLFNIFCLFGYWISGALSEKIGRRITLVYFSLIGALVIPLYSLTHTYYLAMLGAILTGLFALGLWGVIPAYLTERFPTSMRAVGIATAFGIGAGIGSFGPTLQTLLVQKAGFTLGQAIALGTASCLVALTIAALLGPEPKGRVFSADN